MGVVRFLTDMAFSLANRKRSFCSLDVCEGFIVGNDSNAIKRAIQARFY